METGSCCCCWLATPYWGFVGAEGPAGEETGLTGGAAVGVQEDAAAAALAGLAAGPKGEAGPVSIAATRSLPATKAYEGLGGLAAGLAGRGGGWQLAGIDATTLLALGVPAAPRAPRSLPWAAVGTPGWGPSSWHVGPRWRALGWWQPAASPCLHSLDTP